MINVISLVTKFLLELYHPIGIHSTCKLHHLEFAVQFPVEHLYEKIQPPQQQQKCKWIFDINNNDNSSKSFLIPFTCSDKRNQKIKT